MSGRGAATVAVIVLFLFPGAGFASDDSVPDKLIVEEPTFHCLGVEWFVKGDDNANAAVALAYRKAGTKEWRDAMPLWRVDSTGRIRKIPEGQVLFAGSVFGLEPGAKYELKLTLKDSDGGGAEEILPASTRPELSLPADMRLRCVVPGDGGGSGTKEDPFKGLAAADEAAQPGDIVQLGPGTYKGTWKVTKSGAEGRPIVWRGPADNSAIIDGGWAERAVSAEGISHVWFEHLSITNARWALVAHGSSYVVMRYCRVYEVDNGFAATRNPMKGNVVVDNVFEGRVAWMVNGRRPIYPEPFMVLGGKRYDITDMHAVDVSGEGTVVAYNRMRFWGDGIHGSGDQPKCANDLYNNEISECSDDGIECDNGAQNIRVWNNRITSVFQGISTQPVYGGPVYIFRNALYNIDHEPYKLHNRPHGVLLINNTSVRAANREGGLIPVWTNETVYHVLAANNLFVGRGENYSIDLSPPLKDVQFDYNGYAGGPSENFARWNSVVYPTLADFQAKTGQEKHAVLMSPKGLFASGAMPPEDADKDADVALNDLRLAPKAAAIDAGAVFPGITDGYAGKAPDLGACELGAELPHYGPRPEK